MDSMELAKALKQTRNLQQREKQRQEQKREERRQQQERLEQLLAEPRRIQHEATLAMAEFLDEGQVILKNYVLKRGTGIEKRRIEDTWEVHGIVVGKWRGEEVIVFVEVDQTICMSAWYSYSAFCTMLDSIRYWSLMVKAGQWNMNKIYDWYLKKNFKNMKVEAHGHRKVMVGFGAIEFSDKALVEFKSLPSWFQLQPNSNGKFEATFHEGVPEYQIKISSSDSDETSEEEDD